MQNTSALYKILLALPNHWFETKVNIDGVDYAETRLFSVKTTRQMFTSNPEVGKAVAGEIEVSLLNPTVDIPKMAVVVPYVRVSGYTTAADQPEYDDGVVAFPDSTTIDDDIVQFESSVVISNNIVYFNAASELQHSEWIPKGVYYIDTRQTAKNDDGIPLLVLHGYDAMLMTEQYWGEDMIPDGGWDEDGETDIDVVNMIAEKIDVDVDSRTTTDMNGGYKIPFPAGYTLREVLGYLAAPYLGCFVMNDVGELRMISLLDLPPETSYLIDDSGHAITFGGYRILV